ncbi:MAG: hypothetical protein JWR05_447 [Mucilaginibacter sp.]|nr:hypothetical protein [Mucilaginibacter sp.]
MLHTETVTPGTLELIHRLMDAKVMDHKISSDMAALKVKLSAMN